jgi:hypothetical protein
MPRLAGATAARKLFMCSELPSQRFGRYAGGCRIPDADPLVATDYRAESEVRASSLANFSLRVERAIPSARAAAVLFP